MFVDASALTAILGHERDRVTLNRKLVEAETALTSPIAVWETALALARKLPVDPRASQSTVREYLRAANVRWVVLGEAEAAAALEAHERFGKGRHPAALNMGDCFSYACARVHGVPLLFKGEDFALTDIERA